MVENIRLSFQGLWSHKMRSFLTMLGVIIGIASIIAIVSTIKGSNEQTLKNIIGSGSNAVEIQLYRGSETAEMEYDRPDNVYRASDDMKHEIRNLDSAEDATFYLSRGYVENVSYKNDTLTTEGIGLRGIDDHFFSTYGYRIYGGRDFIPADYKNYNKVVILDENAVDIMFSGRNPVGQVIEIKNEPFMIVGVVRQTNAYNAKITSYEDYWKYNGESEGKIFIPNASWPIIYQYDEPETCAVKAVSTKKMSEAGKKAAEIMNQTISGDKGRATYKATNLMDIAKKEQQLNSSNNIMLILVASIALLVGGIGVMNIMLVSVTERTNEIGLKKALGAKKKVILTQFLTESAVLTSIGGIVGVIAGLVLAKVLSRVNGIPFGISIPSIFIAVAFSMCIGIIFGMIPARRAAALDPIEALRRE